MNNIYELIPMTLEEEANAPAAVKAKREVKITVVDRCNLMRQLVDQIAERAKKIPETNDMDHASLVKGFGDAVLFAMLALEDAATGIRFGSNAVERQIYNRVQREYDIEDASSIADEIDVVLTDKEMQEVVRRFRHYHDWTLSDYDQLKAAIEFVVEERR